MKRSHVDKTIVLLKIGERYVPIVESAIKEITEEEEEEEEKEEDGAGFASLIPTVGCPFDRPTSLLPIHLICPILPSLCSVIFLPAGCARSHCLRGCGNNARLLTLPAVE